MTIRAMAGRYLTIRAVAATAVLSLFVLLTSSVTAAGLPAVPEGMEVYVMILHPSGQAAPDVRAAGGQVLHEAGSRQVIAVPEGAAAALERHPRVAALQPVWMGRNEAVAPGREVTVASSGMAVAPSSTTPYWSRAYEYDRSGNVRSAGNDTFAYDTAGRLIRSTVTGRTESYGYDAFGNLRWKGSSAIAVNTSSNQLVGATYDTGHMVTPPRGGITYHYDALGMIVEMGPTANHQIRRMIYTPDDERIAVQTDGGDTRYTVRGFDAKVLREWNQSGEAVEWVRDYVYANGQAVAGERQVPAGDDGRRQYHTDHLGSIRVTSRTADNRVLSANDFQPFGTELTSTAQEDLNFGYRPPDPAKFTGHERDYLGPSNVDNDDYIDYMHARYYSPEWGRFLSVDPGRADLKKPQSWNRYSYTMNNPINNNDPDGRETNPVTGQSYILDSQILNSASNPRKGFFGMVRRNADGSKKKHGGNDIAAPRGTPVFAPVSGTVVQSGDGGKDGGFVLRIRRSTDENGQPVFVHISHLNKARNVKVGDTVVEGQPNVAEVGNTGNARNEPPHAHTAVMVGGETKDHQVDPQQWFRDHPSTAQPQQQKQKDPCEPNKQC